MLCLQYTVVYNFFKNTKIFFLENKAYAKFWRENKEYYDIFEKGL